MEKTVVVESQASYIVPSRIGLVDGTPPLCSKWKQCVMYCVQRCAYYGVCRCLRVFSVTPWHTRMGVGDGKLCHSKEPGKLHCSRPHWAGRWDTITVLKVEAVSKEVLLNHYYSTTLTQKLHTQN
jgi:hypothetical protein